MDSKSIVDHFGDLNDPREDNRRHNHLIRVFREVTSRTPIVFLRNLRMEKAARLLEHTNRSAKEIAALWGVSNTQRLNKVFRSRLRGFPDRVPASFRKQHMNCENHMLRVGCYASIIEE